MDNYNIPQDFKDGLELANQIEQLLNSREKLPSSQAEELANIFDTMCRSLLQYSTSQAKIIHLLSLYREKVNGMLDNDKDNDIYQALLCWTKQSLSFSDSYDNFVLVSYLLEKYNYWAVSNNKTVINRDQFQNYFYTVLDSFNYCKFDAQTNDVIYYGILIK